MSVKLFHFYCYYNFYCFIAGVAENYCMGGVSMFGRKFPPPKKKGPWIKHWSSNDTDHQWRRWKSGWLKDKRQHIPPLNLEELKEEKAVEFAAEVINRFTALDAA